MHVLYVLSWREHLIESQTNCIICVFMHSDTFTRKPNVNSVSTQCKERRSTWIQKPLKEISCWKETTNSTNIVLTCLIYKYMWTISVSPTNVLWLGRLEIFFELGFSIGNFKCMCESVAFNLDKRVRAQSTFHKYDLLHISMQCNINGVGHVYNKLNRLHKY